MTRKEAKPLLDRFANEILLKPPFLRYFAAASLSTKNEEGETVSPGSENEVFFNISLKEELPHDLQLPEEFEGVPVITKVTGSNSHP